MDLIYKNQYFVTKPDADFFNTIVHEDQFPQTSLSVGYRIGQWTFEASSPIGCRALIPVVRGIESSGKARP
jgi:hypothetical protein